MYEGQIRPKTGSPGILSHELESDFALFIKHCDLLRIPQTCLKFKDDIWNYIDYHNLTIKKLEDDGPGEVIDLCERKRMHCSRMGTGRSTSCQGKFPPANPAPATPCQQNPFPGQDPPHWLNHAPHLDQVAQCPQTHA